MKKSILGASLALMVAGPVQANDWEYTVVPYLWGPEFRTSLDIGPNPPVDGNESIFDILDGLFLIAGEARNGRWAIGAEFNYLDLSDTVGFGPFDELADWELEGTMSSIVGSYAIYADDRSRFETFAGLRHWDLDLSTTVLNRTVSTDRSWTDPIIGGRYSRVLNDRWAVGAMGNVGGFGYGSDFQWEAVIQANWKWTDRVDLSGGYRHLSVDFEEGQDVIDLILTGPFAALAYSF